MLLENFLNERQKLIRGVKVKFKSLNGKNGKVMSVSTEDGQTFILEGSLKNYHRFANWDDKSSLADLLPIRGKFQTSKGFFPLARIRTTVYYDKPLDSENPEYEKDQEGNQVF